MTQQSQEPDKLQKLMEQYEREQREFENHWLWKELGTTPKDFFAKINDAVDQSGIDKKLWEAKLAEAKKAIETRVREQKGSYKPVSFQHLKGLRA